MPLSSRTLRTDLYNAWKWTTFLRLLLLIQRNCYWVLHIVIRCVYCNCWSWRVNWRQVCRLTFPSAQGTKRHKPLRWVCNEPGSYSLPLFSLLVSQIFKMKCFNNWGASFFVILWFEWEFKLFVLFSFKPTTKSANGSRSTFLGAFGFQVGFECQFFPYNYTGSYCILSVFSLLFFCQMNYLPSSLTLLPFSRTCQFKSVQKIKL